MIEEAYVAVETAKLLKKKGFNELCHCEHHSPYRDGIFYHRKKKNFNGEEYSNLTTEWSSVPTQQLAMRWLREKHNLCIEPYRTACGYLYNISKIWTGSELYSSEFEGDDEASGQYTTYEKAVEAAIGYCLRYLI